MFAPVATGVVILDGSSDVKMVALDGEIRYLEFKVPTKASLKPTRLLVWGKVWNMKRTCPLLCYHSPR